MRVFIYLRVSTDDQEDNTSLEQQEKDCQEYCEHHGFMVAGAFREVFTSSVWRERKQFMEMRERYLRGEATGSDVVGTSGKLLMTAARTVGYTR